MQRSEGQGYRAVSYRACSSELLFVLLRLWRVWKRSIRRHTANSPATLPVCVVWAIALAICYQPLLLRVNRDIAPEDNLLPDFWAHRKLIFCVSPGRAGSKYLSAVLACAKNVISVHEPVPKMNDAILRDVIIHGRRTQTFETRARMKIQAIQDTLMDTAADVAYAETTHMFVKTFADVILDELAAKRTNLTIIVLHRNLQDVVLSQLKLGWFAPNHSGNNVWYYDVHDVHMSERHDVSFLSTAESGTMQQLDRILAYNADIAARAKAIEERVKHDFGDKFIGRIHLFHTNLEDISSDSGSNIEEFIKYIGLEPDPERLAVLSLQDTNARRRKKESSHSGLPEQIVKQRVQHAISSNVFGDGFL